MKSFLTLIFGPAAVIAGCYWLTFGMPDFAGFAAGHSRPLDPGRSAGPLTESQQSALNDACTQEAAALQEQLGNDAAVLVRAPYVLAGDVGLERLEKLHEKLVLPISRALQTSYFDHRPTEPISLVVLSGSKRFREFSAELGGPARNCYSGYYLRERRRVVVNIATGPGTLAHELTHALAHVDCPHLPEWFDEGLASLHEECVYSDDGLRLIGRPNWRLQHLVQSLQTGGLPGIESLMTSGDLRGENEARAYAQARSFCLYLQERGLLEPYYRKLKHTAERDPTGVLALKELLHVDSLDAFDRDFERWLQRQAGIGSKTADAR